MGSLEQYWEHKTKILMEGNVAKLPGTHLVDGAVSLLEIYFSETLAKNERTNTQNYSI